MDLITLPNEVDFNWLNNIQIQKRKQGNQGNNKKIKYKNLISAFDIESSKIKEIRQAIMYVWQLQLGNDITVIGRTWEEFINLMERMVSTLDENEYYVIFVHNLSYEFQFLRGIYDFQPHEVFALKSRRILKCTMFDHIEFRCSAIHSNMKLEEFLKNMDVANKKISGEEFDYEELRLPWTPIEGVQLQYIINDVKGLVQAITKDMAVEDDNLYTYPLTATGYVRRDVKHAMKNVSFSFVSGQLPSPNLYTKLREAFRGGNTHANRFYSGIVLDGVRSADRVSSYPDVLCNDKFPVSQFIDVGIQTMEQIKELIYTREKAVIMRISVTGLRLRDENWGCPYIPKDKVRQLSSPIVDNGRLLSCEYMEMTITDIDFKIILDEYDWDDIAFFDVSHARYGYLPKPLVDTIIKYFKGKTELKGIEEMKLLYDKSKAKVNGIYGMMAQDPIRAVIMYVDGQFHEEDINLVEQLIASNKKAFLCYQWGVWTTAYARYRLEEGIKLAGEGFVYTDTDSVKYMGDIDWEPYNNLRIEASKRSGAFAQDIKGNTHYMGLYEMENDGKAYDKFITLGAKKYCTEMNGELHLTLAGVNKKKGSKELQKMGGIEYFREGTIFVEGGGLNAVYNDENYGTYEIDGRQINITSNMVLEESHYKLGIGEEYKNILKMCRKDVDKMLFM